MVIIRVRSPAGTFRINDVDLNMKMGDFVTRIEKEKSIKITKISLQQNLKDEVNSNKTLNQIGLKHGSMIFVKVGAGVVVIGGTRREIGEDGKIKSGMNKNGFLPGLQALGDQKRAWNLTDMIELEKKYVFKMKGTKPELCSKADLDIKACESFNTYITRSLKMKQCRCGILYGKYIDSENEVKRKEREAKLKERDEKHKKAYGSTKEKMRIDDLQDIRKLEEGSRYSVLVEAIYEPLQKGTKDTFELLEDPNEKRVNAVAKALGLQVVGMVVSRPQADKFKGSELVAHEIIAGAETSLEASKGQRESPFVVVSVTLNDAKQLNYEAFSLTEMCLEMAAEGALSSLDEDPTHCQVKSPFSAIVENKETHVVDNDFFCKPVPIANHDSPLKDIGQEFPKMNRDLTPAPDQNSLRNYFRQAVGSAGKKVDDAGLARALANFHLLIHLSRTVKPEAGLEEVCKFVKERVFDKNTKAQLSPKVRQDVLKAAGL